MAKGGVQADNSARFYDQLAPSYDGELTRWRGDLWTRSAFHHHVLDIAPAGGRLLDFGCGTGLDARFYAEQGYRVLAYDNSPGMVEQLRQRLKAEGDRGLIEPWTAHYEAFLEELPRHQPFDGGVTNFAVLNQIEDLEPLFAALAEAIPAPGFVLANVLNPFFWREAVLPGRWPACVGALRSGRIRHSSQHLETCRHTLGAFERMAGPGWTLKGWQSVGLLIRHHGAPRGEDWSRPSTWAEKVDVRLGRRWPWSRLGRYLILIFQRAA